MTEDTGAFFDTAGGFAAEALLEPARVHEEYTILKALRIADPNLWGGPTPPWLIDLAVGDAIVLPQTLWLQTMIDFGFLGPPGGIQHPRYWVLKPLRIADPATWGWNPPVYFGDLESGDRIMLPDGAEAKKMVQDGYVLPALVPMILDRPYLEVLKIAGTAPSAHASESALPPTFAFGGKLTIGAQTYSVKSRQSEGTGTVRLDLVEA